ncbi:MAG: hypothetical protein ACRD2W_19100, partial [Acidimicrobiales bacterium]
LRLQPSAAPARAPLPNLAIGVWALVAMGTFMRLLLLGSPLGELDADSAVTGLMALHMADGEFPALFWGSHYGGTIESLVGGAVFRVLPASTTVIMVVPMLFSAASAVLVWRVGRRVVGEQGPGWRLPSSGPGRSSSSGTRPGWGRTSRRSRSPSWGC